MQLITYDIDQNLESQPQAALSSVLALGTEQWHQCLGFEVFQRRPNNPDLIVTDMGSELAQTALIEETRSILQLTGDVFDEADFLQSMQHEVLPEYQERIGGTFIRWNGQGIVALNTQRGLELPCVLHHLGVGMGLPYFTLPSIMHPQVRMSAPSVKDLSAVNKLRQLGRLGQEWRSNVGFLFEFGLLSEHELPISY